MPTQILVADTAYQEAILTFAGVSLFSTITFNTRDERWYLDLQDRNQEDLVSGIKILPSQNLTGKYNDITKLIEGNIYCVDTKNSGKDVSRDTLGTNKQFQLWYVTTQEEIELLGD